LKFSCYETTGLTSRIAFPTVKFYCSQYIRLEQCCLQDQGLNPFLRLLTEMHTESLAPYRYPLHSDLCLSVMKTCGPGTRQMVKWFIDTELDGKQLMWSTL
jgi:hypothetical protein